MTINRGHLLNLHVAWLEWTRDWGIARQHTGILIIPPIGGEVSVDRVVLEITGFLNHQPPLANECYEWKPDRNAWWRYLPPDGNP